jgi:hypothetical protein
MPEFTNKKETMPSVYEYIISLTDKFSPVIQKINGGVTDAVGKMTDFTERHGNLTRCRNYSSAALKAYRT